MPKELTHKDRPTDLGSVRINNDAITTIASVAALEIKGVRRMGGGIARTLYASLFRRACTKGVRVHTSENNEFKLTVYIVVDYGVDIPRVADEVQENVKRAVEKMAGLALSGIDVVVEGVHADILSDRPRGRG